MSVPVCADGLDDLHGGVAKAPPIVGAAPPAPAPEHRVAPGQEAKAWL